MIFIRNTCRNWIAIKNQNMALRVGEMESVLQCVRKAINSRSKDYYAKCVHNEHSASIKSKYSDKELKNNTKGSLTFHV